EELTCRMALATYRNINIETAERFEALGITATDFFSKPASTLAAITQVKQNYFDDERRAKALASARQERLFVDEHDIKALYFNEESFPERLLRCVDGPAMLYAMGHVEAAAAKHCISIVGTRHATAYGVDFTRRLVEDLADALDDVLIVSGLAYGIDIAAHRAALSAGIPTAAVLAHGLNTVYPADHRNDAREILRNSGFIATEYCSWQQTHKGNFLARNRIIAGLSDLTIVVESDIKGGAMSTARIASAYNRDVMALPGRINDTYSRGCNELIANGTAALIRDASDVLALMNWTGREKPGNQKEISFEIPDRYVPVLDLLRERPDATVNDICVRLNMPFAHISALLFQMELEDYVISLPGGRYTLPSVNN
ncbi:MAG: DNA-processing protein DprA, partial [Muribaculaceae bacterium]|nr:DNA-processing protein DprA [Muribaculaceae bacterium]